ncbi:HPr family phosphocarrier protein [Cupriavidus sp. L7L]|uniref:HPr family phosphocarrier protein n=1 Tax=Cupriavidus sp. L7L TaxID=2546443 RepID=UPI0010559B68|nr:HPr family phosphocarrier protein [Cupriavidus sp. L7L]TDF67046.1 HPr family phosphocarrier protein [Cupriavidus sp. L7L]
MVEATIDGLAGLIFQGRSSARLSLAASRFASSIMLATASGSANARDVMAVMRLRVPPGTPLRIRADGPDIGRSAAAPGGADAAALAHGAGRRPRAYR